MSNRESDGDEKLSGAWNFRDVAGLTGVRPGLFFRSSELSHLDHSGRQAMTELGISDVADLRSHVELERRGGGAVPDGVVVHHLPFPDLSHGHADDGSAPHEASWQKMMTEYSDDEPTEAAHRWMTQEYERFPTLGGAQRAVHLIITMLGEGRPVLVHCFAGKDRTGFAVAVALEAAGVDRDFILADYLRSNAAVPRLRDRILDSVRNRDGMTPEVASFAESRLTEEVLGVREDYLESARRVLDETYGGLPGYLAASGVAADDIARLRGQLLG
ncbi:MAG: tyrosine-protein phosphatase [Mycobacterium sp.]|jgi:protein-tyrosine phosphatase